MFIMTKLRYNDTTLQLSITTDSLRGKYQTLLAQVKIKSHEAVTDIENIYFPKKFFLHLPLESYLHSPC